jgi:hypothetical protein
MVMDVELFQPPPLGKISSALAEPFEKFWQVYVLPAAGPQNAMGAAKRTTMTIAWSTFWPR